MERSTEIPPQGYERRNMARLQASRKNYRGAYQKHAYTYAHLQDASDLTKRMILCYCVECGLKYLIMEDRKIAKTAQADAECASILASHDFRVLLKALRQAGRYSFADFRTEYGDCVNSENYHQLCRYNIEAKAMGDIREYDSTLKKIEQWLREVI